MINDILIFNALDGKLAVETRKKHPTARILCCEWFPGYEGWLQRLEFETCKCYTMVDGKKILTFEALDGMKFDLILGNPPYQNSDKDEGNKLWARIVKHSYQNNLKENGVMVFITPTTWMTPSNDAANFSIMREIFQKKQLEWADIRSSISSEFFPGVGQAISVWMLTQKPKEYPTRFITDNGEMMIDLSDDVLLPKDINHTALSIVRKFTGTPWEWEGQKGYGYTQKKRTEECQFPYYHTVSQGNWYGNEKHPKAEQPKVMVSLSGYYEPVFSDSIGYTSMCVTLPLSSREEGLIAQSVLSSRLYRWAHAQFKHGGFNNIRTIVGFPSVDLSRTWTDQELYTHFGLTDEEIQYIEEQVV